MVDRKCKIPPVQPGLQQSMAFFYHIHLDREAEPSLFRATCPSRKANIAFENLWMQNSIEFKDKNLVIILNITMSSNLKNKYFKRYIINRPRVSGSWAIKRGNTLNIKPGNKARFSNKWNQSAPELSLADTIFFSILW